MIKSLQDESRILRAEVECLKTIQTDNNLLKKEFKFLKEENRSLSNMTLSTEQNLEKVQSDIKERFTIVEEGTADLDRKLQSLSVGSETLSERIKTAECDNRILSKGYDRLADRLSIQEGTIHAMKIISKDELFSNGRTSYLRILNEGFGS